MRLGLAALLALAVAAPSRAADGPSWLKQAAGMPEATTPAAAVVLLDTADITVTDDGELRTVRRFAVRVRTSDGRAAAALRHVYINPSGRVKRVRAWIVGSAGGVRQVGDDRVVDAAVASNDVYNEVRVRAIAAGDGISAGEVFGAELDAEERLLFAQLEWPLQDRWAVRVARRSLHLPRGWTAASVTFNGAPVEPRSEGGRLVWEARELPAIEDEPAMPAVAALALRVAVSFFAPAGSRQSGQFETWDEVAAWLHSLSAPSPSQSHAAAARARELAGQLPTALDRTRAIARHVQRLQYVSIQTGLGRGGGYQPRPPDLVLARSYGDCKDKATLMRAMLAGVGIDSYLVSVFSGDRRYVREQWPSPQQFNHVVIGIALPGAPPDASTIEHETLGRLMLFDPTDEHTPFGELPLHEQGGLALIVAPGGGLRRIPVAGTARHGTVREIDAVLDARGALVATIRETLKGDDATQSRALRHALDPTAYRQHVERGLSTVLPGARLTRLDVAAGETADVTVELEVHVPSHAQSAGTLILVKPLVALDKARLAIPADRRRHPFVQEPLRREESIRLRLPSGVAIDEMPKPVVLSGVFGRYNLSYSEASGTVVARRSLELPLTTVDPAQQRHLRVFLERIRAADEAPLVLVRR